MKNVDLKKRIIELSYKYKLSHIGSCLSAVDIIEGIYHEKDEDEKFVLSSGHAALALYVVIEKHEGIDAEKIFNHHGVHPDRCKECHLYCSTGSLGHGLPIALGMALANRDKVIYCLISDGECSEGSIWEALRIAKEQQVDNLFVYVNINGFGAYKEINSMQLSNQLEYMSWATPKQANLLGLPKWLQGQEAHYLTMDKKRYKELLGMLA